MKITDGEQDRAEKAGGAQYSSRDSLRWFMRLSCLLTVCISAWFSCVSPVDVWAKDPATETGLKVCVAEVNNQTAKSLMVERMTERLVKNLRTGKVSAVKLDSSTSSARELRPTVENSEESKAQECNYVVLTQVTDPRSRPTDLGSPQISIGGRRPSTDVSDRADTVRDSVEVNFAVFRIGSPGPILDTRIVDEVSANVADSLMEAMDREGNRIEGELKKNKAR